jgi:hypothetical protein
MTIGRVEAPSVPQDYHFQSQTHSPLFQLQAEAGVGIMLGRVKAATAMATAREAMKIRIDGLPCISPLDDETCLKSAFAAVTFLTSAFFRSNGRDILRASGVRKCVAH